MQHSEVRQRRILVMVEQRVLARVPDHESLPMGSCIVASHGGADRNRLVVCSYTDVDYDPRQNLARLRRCITGLQSWPR